MVTSQIAGLSLLLKEKFQAATIKTGHPGYWVGKEGGTGAGGSDPRHQGDCAVGGLIMLHFLMLMPGPFFCVPESQLLHFQTFCEWLVNHGYMLTVPALGLGLRPRSLRPAWVP